MQADASSGMKMNAHILALSVAFGCLVDLLNGHILHNSNRDYSKQAVHFARSRRDVPCGRNIVDDSGSITLPTVTINDTHFYGVNQNCIWTIQVKSGHHIVLSSEYFNLELSENCMWDYVEIEENGTTPNNTRYCGWNPIVYVSTSNQLTIRFKSDESYEDLGFKFHYISVSDNDPTHCNSSIIAGNGGEITNNGALCYYRIEAKEHQLVKLKLLEFATPFDCKYESISVYRGRSSQTESIETICNEKNPKVLPFRGNKIFIEYKNTAGNTSQRFRINYTFEDNDITTAPSLSTTVSPIGGNSDCSHMYKDMPTNKTYIEYTAPEYQNNKECVIVVRNTILLEHFVQIEFVKFELEESENCQFDYLKVISGERNDSTTLGGPYCGDSLKGKIFVTHGNSLRLEFKTDESLSFFGFKANISFVPYGGCACEGRQVCVRQGYEKLCLESRLCTVDQCLNGGTCVGERCYCRSGFTGLTCSQQEAVVGRLRFIRPPQNRNLKRGSNHAEECVVEVPRGQDVIYSWTFKGMLIGPYKDSANSSFGYLEGGVLRISKFNDQMEGSYSCFASTATATAEHTFEYRIVDNCAASIYPGPKSESKKTGEHALIACVVKNAREVRWLKDGHIINFEQMSRYKKLGNYLDIPNIETGDEGVYRCEAVDAKGCSSYKEGKLSVINVKRINEYCGITSNDNSMQGRISKGREPKQIENPWHVILRTNFGSLDETFCGGTLISEKFVLTAAHCIAMFEETTKRPWDANNVKLILGTTDCAGAVANEGTVRTFSSYHIHPNYDLLATLDSDIALIELESPVEFTDTIRPICIESNIYNERAFFDSRSAPGTPYGKVTGCGYSPQRQRQARKLQEVYLPYVAREHCMEWLHSINTTYDLTANMFCAGSNIERMGDSCRGDSGGGYMMSDNVRFIQTGIVSWSIGECDLKNTYGVYTNIGNFYDWIDSIAKISEEAVSDFLKR